jgi:hypothetical protein
MTGTVRADMGAARRPADAPIRVQRVGLLPRQPPGFHHADSTVTIEVDAAGPVVQLQRRNLGTLWS